MAWGTLASNQCVSLENLQNAVTTGVFTLKNTIPSSAPANLKLATKANASFYVYFDETNGAYTAKASNQLVVKSNLPQLPTQYTYIILYPAIGDNWYTSSAACAGIAGSNRNLTVYSTSATFGVDAPLFTDIYCTTPAYFGTTEYLGYNNSWFRVQDEVEGIGHIVSEIGSCAAPTYDIYYATEYSCATSNISNYSVLVGIPAGTTVSYNNMYYPSDPNDGYVYEIYSSGSGGPFKIITDVNANSTLALACSVA